MRQKFFTFWLLVISYSLFVIPGAAWAAKGDIRKWLNDAAVIAGIDTTKGDPILIWAAVVKAALGFAGVIFFAYIMYAGFLWMTAMGEQEKITKAKDTLIHSTIGFVLLLGSYVIVKYLVDELAKVMT